MRKLEPLVLDTEEQVTLVGLLLRLWGHDLEATENEHARRARVAYRNRLRFERRGVKPDGLADHDPLAIETEEVLGERLAAMHSEADALQLLVTACSSQPWIGLHETHRAPLNPTIRLKVLTEAAEAMPGAMNAETLAAIDHVLFPPLRSRALKAARNPRVAALVLGGGTAAILSAGVAAPAIGAAIGGSMGLSGAAATSAGLAALGGGSIASGGLGMAGGTYLIGALGAAGGAGLTAAATPPSSESDEQAQDIAAQEAQLIALTTVGQQLSEPTRRAVIDQVRLIEIEIARLIDLRARVVSADKEPQIETDLERSLSLRRMLQPKFVMP